ncbi:hypothetical protein V496_08609 [Pseudogymnoascus sp. VKM F-4515 (FW-2607)]|nr:hypothetical protein V496_08609 [Pseudogymnoascus sp. VKM F-4515 (FW-2607)]
MKRHEEMMKPVPPMTWGAQYAPSMPAWESDDWIEGRALVEGGEPDPGVEDDCFCEFLGRERFLRLVFRDFAFADEVPLVRVVVCAILPAGPQAQQPIVPERLFKGPAEALGAVLVDGLDHEEDAADLEDGGADKGGDAAGGCGFAGEGGGRAHGGQPHEEGVEDPDHGAPGEPLRDEVGDVPDGVVGEHEPEGVEDWAEGVGGWGGEEVAVGGGGDGYGMSACCGVLAIGVCAGGRPSSREGALGRVKGWAIGRLCAVGLRNDTGIRDHSFIAWRRPTRWTAWILKDDSLAAARQVPEAG